MKLSNDEMNALHLLFDEMNPQMAECFDASVAYGGGACSGDCKGGAFLITDNRLGI